MTIGQALRNYRVENKISQATLAKNLGISPMTASRLEDDQNIRINRDLALAIASLLGDNAVASVDESTHTYALLIRELSMHGSGSFIQQDTPDIQELRHRCMELIKSSLRESSVSVITRRSGLEYIECEHDSKIWRFDVFPPASASNIYVRLATGIGLTAMEQSVNRYTLIWCTESMLDIDSLASIHCSQSLNFDVSVLHYNTVKSRFDFELDIAFHDDGKGFFDLKVPEKEVEASTLYATWKTSLNK